MIKYKFFKKINNVICSIDNLVLYFFSFRHTDILKYIRENYNTDDSSYYEILDNKACSKYQYWKDHIHCGNLYVKLGKYVFQKESKKFDSCDIVSFEINPNKHFDSIEYKIMEDLISLYCDGGGWIHQFDFAIDVPCKFNDLIVFPDGRSEPGLYKGTKYFGSHNSSGFTKIYNKTKESNLTFDLTRVEVSYKTSPDNFPSLPYGDIVNPFKIIDFGVVNSLFKIDLKGQMKSLAIAVQILEAAGLSSDSVLSPLGYRQRVKIREAASGGVYRINIPESVIRDLLDLVCYEFDINSFCLKEPRKKFTRDFYFSDIVSDEELPF